jgi:predicted RNase H-like HicB family nuclease
LDLERISVRGYIPEQEGAMTTITVTIEAKNVRWRAQQNPATGFWVAACDALGVTAHGDTFAELNACMIEIVNHLLMDLLKDGEFDAFLRERGWKAKGRVPTSHELEDVRFDLPYDVERVNAAA